MKNLSGRKNAPKKQNKTVLHGLRIVLYLAAVFFLSFYVFDSYLNRKTENVTEPSSVEDVATEYSAADKEKLEAIFDEVAFYDETADDNIKIDAFEEPKPELLENAEAVKPAEDDSDMGFKLIPLPEEEYLAVLERLGEEEGDEEALAQKYEEKLPDDIIRPNGKTDVKQTVKSNIVPVQKPDFLKRPHIAVVIDDMGISARRTADIASLQAPLTASFLTYSRNLEAQIETSRRAGQEIMIHVPMEAQSNTNVAPDVLTTAMTTEEIKNNLEIMLAKFKDVKGINNHMGSKLTEDKERMLAVMEVLKKYGLFFLDSKTSAKSRVEEAAAESGVAYAHRHVFIDNENEKNYILKHLRKAEKIALRNGYAIAIGHPKSQTYIALKEWLPSLRDKQIELIPLSQIVDVINSHEQED